MKTTITLLSTLLLVPLAGLSAAQNSKPNIVYFLVDDMGYADCGFNGGKDIRTPNIDKLAAAEDATPNIVYILADDLGYGDVHCFNPERGKIATPHLDRLAAEGMVFTDAHSSSSVCTPTRYGVLTGRYNWRSRLQKGVLYGYSEALIARDRLTVAGFIIPSTDPSTSGRANGNSNSAPAQAAGASQGRAARRKRACPTCSSTT